VSINLVLGQSCDVTVIKERKNNWYLIRRELRIQEKKQKGTWMHLLE
jgi:hypothetical protein